MHFKTFFTTLAIAIAVASSAFAYGYRGQEHFGHYENQRYFAPEYRYRSGPYTRFEPFGPPIAYGLLGLGVLDIGSTLWLESHPDCYNEVESYDYYGRPLYVRTVCGEY